jgi:hypothetical protein
MRSRREQACVHDDRARADCGTIRSMSETEQRNETEHRKRWNFPEGSVGHDQSVKGYAVEATDGRIGTVSWASYAPGESYLVVSYRDGHHEVHHVVPAGAVVAVDHERQSLSLKVAVAEVKATPTHEEPQAAVDWNYVDQFERGALGAGFVWPYTDV